MIVTLLSCLCQADWAQSCGVTSLRLSMALSKNIRTPPASLYELKVYLSDVFPGLENDPTHRPWAEYDCLEIFGQSRAIREGFASRGLKAMAFDYRLLAGCSETVIYI